MLFRAIQPRDNRDSGRFRTFTSSSDDTYSPVGLPFSARSFAQPQPAALRDERADHVADVGIQEKSRRRVKNATKTLPI